MIQPAFTSIHNAILNENINDSIFVDKKTRIPFYSSDSIIRRLLIKSQVHNYDIVDDSNRIVRLDWLGEKYSYYLFLGIKNKVISKNIFCESCKSFWFGDTVLLQRHYTPLVFVY
jgi:hypothetical protein